MATVAGGCGSVIGGGLGVVLIAVMVIGACILMKRKSNE